MGGQALGGSSERGIGLRGVDERGCKSPGGGGRTGCWGWG